MDSSGNEEVSGWANTIGVEVTTVLSPLFDLCLISGGHSLLPNS